MSFSKNPPVLSHTRIHIHTHTHTYTPAIDVHTVDVGGVGDMAEHHLDTVHMAFGS